MGRSTGKRAESEARIADEALLVKRLGELGVRRPVVVHENRIVTVSVGRANQLRIHRAYAYSSDRILKAIIKFVNATSRAVRSVAEREIRTFPVDSLLPSKRRPCRRINGRRDRQVLAELGALHARFNAELFGGALSPVRFRISDRMRTKLGEVTVDSRSRRVIEIAISRRHWERDGRIEAEKTLLHEMIHQWQAESRIKVDHGVSFRRKAREIGVAPVAMRMVERPGKPTTRK